MQSQTAIEATSKTNLWAGRLITALTAAFLLFDAAVKVLNLPLAVEATTRLGYPARLAPFLGIVELVCLAAYLYRPHGGPGRHPVDGVPRRRHGHAGEVGEPVVSLPGSGRHHGVGRSVPS